MPAPTRNDTSSSASSRRSPDTCRCRSRSSRSRAPSPLEVSDGAALWTKPRAEIEAADYTDFYRSAAGQFDEPALTIHSRAEGRQEYTTLLFVPSTPAIRHVRSGAQRPDQALRQARFHHRRCRSGATLSAIRPRHRGLRRSAAQRFTRDDPGKPDPGGDQERRDQPGAERDRKARREGRRSLRQGLGCVRHGDQGRHCR